MCIQEVSILEVIGKPGVIAHCTVDGMRFEHHGTLTFDGRLYCVGDREFEADEIVAVEAETGEGIDGVQYGIELEGWEEGDEADTDDLTDGGY
jgi:hypothetical protein